GDHRDLHSVPTRRSSDLDALSGLINEGCSCAPHWWRQSKTVPSASRIWPKSSCSGGVSGWPKSDWYHFKLLTTSLTPMIVHVRFIAVPPSAYRPASAAGGSGPSAL